MRRFRDTLAAALLFLIAADASAQNRFSPEQMRERMEAQIEETVEALALEGDKAESVRAILMMQSEKRVKMQQEMRARRGQRGQGQRRGNREGMQAMREHLQKLEAETADMLSQVLSEEEMEKYVELVASRRGNRRRGAPVQ